MARKYLSGKGARLWLRLVADATKAPWSPTAVFAPSYVDAAAAAALTTASAEFIGNLVGIPDLSVGPDLNPTATSELLGWMGVVEGVSSGEGSFKIQCDKNAALGSKIVTGEGNLYDFVITLDFVNASTLTGGSAAGAIVGRLAPGKVSTPIEVTGGNVEFTLQFRSEGKIYGDVVGRPVN